MAYRKPRKPVDAEEVFKLAQIGCKTNEIADWFGVSRDTIERKFAAELTKGRLLVRQSLRRWQLEAAKKGNVAMLIWLGKQMLGQTDTPMTEEQEELYKPIASLIKDAAKNS